MTKPYSEAFKRKMVERLIGKDAISAVQLSRETGVRQQNLSRWLMEVRSLPRVAPQHPKQRTWRVSSASWRERRERSQRLLPFSFSKKVDLLYQEAEDDDTDKEHDK